MSPTMIKIDRLVGLVRDASALPGADWASNELATLDRAELPLGRSTAQSFIRIMDRRARMTTVLTGWKDLMSVLLEMDPAEGIVGVALPGGSSVVLDGDSNEVLGFVVHAAPGPCR